MLLFIEVFIKNVTKYDLKHKKLGFKEVLYFQGYISKKPIKCNIHIYLLFKGT